LLAQIQICTEVRQAAFETLREQRGVVLERPLEAFDSHARCFSKHRQQPIRCRVSEFLAQWGRYKEIVHHVVSTSG
jgi:hypothetical protein